MSDLSSKVSGIAAAVATSAIIGGFVWVQEVSTRLALVEDDLGETVDVISLLHPPSMGQVAEEQETFLASDKRQELRSKLEQLKQQVAVPPAKGDDDDSAAPKGDDDDSSVAAPKLET